MDKKEIYKKIDDLIYKSIESEFDEHVASAWFVTKLQNDCKAAIEKYINKKDSSINKDMEKLKDVIHKDYINHDAKTKSLEKELLKEKKDQEKFIEWVHTYNGGFKRIKWNGKWLGGNLSNPQTTEQLHEIYKKEVAKKNNK